MPRKLQLSASALIFFALPFGAVKFASAEMYDCKYENPDEYYVELDPHAGTYSHEVLSPSEDNHIEAGLASETKFAENEGAIAAVQHVMGMQQAGKILEGSKTYLSTIHMSADGKFVEVIDGEVKRGQCTKQQADADVDAGSQTGAIGGDRYAHPWDNTLTAIVLDPFKGNSIDWNKVKTDTRVAGVIHKASQGLTADNKYGERKKAATDLGYAWGSYHLLTNGNATQQIDHYLGLVGTDEKESRAVDVECLAGSASCQSASFKVTVASVESALRRVKEKTGYFPLLYANHSVATILSARWRDNAEFSDVRLWYARFKKNVTDFPKRPWDSYSLWQFSSEINCGPAACPYRVPGTDYDMDLNVYFGTPAQLKRNWPLER